MVVSTILSVASLQGIINTLQAFPLFVYLFSFIKDLVVAVLKTGPIPRHVALIMDGNRTYAKRNQLALKDGHSAGAESLLSVLDVCYRVGVSYITIYAFSIENFNRSSEEVDTLFGLLRDRLKLLCENDDSYASVNKVRIKVIGNRDMIPHDILKDLETIEDKTNTPMVNKVLYVGFPYTSRDDITHSIRTTVDQLNSGEIRRDQIDLEMLQKNMYMGADAPQLDLLVRTSGHTRLSDFMLWQCNANCTIEFVKTLWPDFKFLSIASLLFKWSYYKTLQLQVESAAAEVPHNTHEPTDIFNQLPPPPPFASVTQRQL